MNKRKKKKIIIISCVAGAILLFFVSAVIYNAFFKDKEEGGGINLIGEERAYDNSVVLGKYRGLEYVPYQVSVTQEDVDSYIVSQLEKQPNYEIDYSGDNSPVAEGDILQLTHTIKVDGITYVDNEELIYVSGSLLLGDVFEENLSKTPVGEGFTASIVIPEEYEDENIAGKTGEVTVSIEAKLIQHETITDAYCEKITDGKYKTVAEYEAYCKAYLLGIEESQAEESKWSQIWEQLFENCELTIDEAAVEKEYVDMVDYYESYAEYLNTTLEEMVTTAYGYGTLQDFYDYCKEYARTIVEERTIYDEIIRKENITVSDSMYTQKAEEYMAEAGYTSLKDFESMLGKEQIIEMIESDMVTELLIESAVEVVEE